MEKTKKRKVKTGMVYLSLCLLFLFAVAPLAVSLASAEDDVCATAQADAKADVNKTTYMLAGFLCGVFGWIYSTMQDPSPPADKLVGKSPEYVETYTRCYEKAGEKAQQKAACTGWAVGTVVVLIASGS